MARSRGRADRGAILVEFALILPVLLTFLFGIITAGIAYEQKIAITHAAREGARYGASVAQDQQFTAGTTWATAVQQVVTSRSAGDLNVAGSSVCVSLVEGTSPNELVVSPNSNPPTTNPQSSYTTQSGGAACDTSEVYPTTANDPGRRVQVRISRPGRIDIGIATFTLTLTASATSRYETAGAT